MRSASAFGGRRPKSSRTDGRRQRLLNTEALTHRLPRQLVLTNNLRGGDARVGTPRLTLELVMNVVMNRLLLTTALRSNLLPKTSR